MSVPPYANYKDSGVDWLGNVPAHWQVLRNKILFHEVDERSVSNEGELLTVSHLTGVTPRSEKNVNMTMAETLEGYKNCRSGDLVINTMWAWMGALGISPCDGLVSPSYNVYRARDIAKLDPSYYDYLFRTPSLVVTIKAHSTGVWESRLRLYPDAFLALRSPSPPTEEQRTIASFLDRETAKIDALIAEQQRLITVLEEKRQAVISHAVTKGLNPAAPMKDSGIEWLGDVPKHWIIKRIKYLICSIEQGWSPQCEGFPVETTGDWGVLKVGCVNGGRFNPSENKALPPDLEPIPALGIAANDILISRANSRELVGSAAVALDAHPTLMLCDKLYRLKAIPNVCLPKFIVFYLGTGTIRSQIELAATGASSSMLNIGQSTILELDIGLPPIEEQNAITDFLDRQTAILDALTTEAESAITLLHERRTALISAAVTGKIDVRGSVAARPEVEVAA